MADKEEEAAKDNPVTALTKCAVFELERSPALVTLKEFATVRLCAAAAPAPDIVVPAIIELAPDIAPAAVTV